MTPPVARGWVRRAVVSNGSKRGEGEWVREAHAHTHQDDETLLSSEILLVSKDRALTDEVAPTAESLEIPPATLSLEEQAEHSRSFWELHKRITDAGLYETPYLTGYGPEVARYLSLYILSAVAFVYGWYITSAFFLGLVWHQLTFTAHDLGHMGVTHNWTMDRLLGIFIADFLGGLSIGWWVDNHNIHHLVTNHPTHDPDIQHMPFFAISKNFLNNLYSSYYRRIMLLDAFAAFVLRFQHMLYYFIMSLARFNLYANSYGFLYKRAFEGKRARGGKWTFYLEVVGIVLFWTWYGSLLAHIGNWKTIIAFVLVSHMVPSPLHVQIVLSHFSRSTQDLGPTESFVHRQLRTTTDVICPDSLAFLHGGLHLQVTHHLFPRLPRHNLRKASMMVKEFATERGLTYHEFGFIGGNGQVLGVLKDVADQAAIIHMVAREEVQEAMQANHTKTN
ncbi:hypothetical protein M408DRAFT_333402 [Serendipita vermifera MAFF 305830]|uniref:Fatty acid desaturase domain-containing protein n=1 Tax=Serendipita vermifera MAFF 305830 TaxID=933852 RepID=A0A0C3AA80_SERVB|nr:hypothetical protein M408DRAFT_333402 [Serendipita vermifera MAFF 305830]